ncbi:hypothetical protein OPQ81_009588 [Rhizoctonia solani]|nr:hypothetical protein OPQ81_009588 [Rhizoctonia solani]
MDRKELETYQVQLSQVELALASDPDNEELTSLRSELKELISLTEAALAQDESAPAASSSSTSAPASSSNNRKQPAAPVASFQAGDECLAKYSGDGQWATTPPSSSMPLPSSECPPRPSASARKKKNEKKLEVRAQKAKEQNNKQAAWQKFAKKSEKKGVVIAGVQGSSIFKTPDNPYGRVGVTGSGRGMTDMNQTYQGSLVIWREQSRVVAKSKSPIVCPLFEIGNQLYKDILSDQPHGHDITQTRYLSVPYSIVTPRATAFSVSQARSHRLTGQNQHWSTPQSPRVPGIFADSVAVSNSSYESPSNDNWTEDGSLVVSGYNNSFMSTTAPSISTPASTGAGLDSYNAAFTPRSMPRDYIASPSPPQNYPKSSDSYADTGDCGFSPYPTSVASNISLSNPLSSPPSQTSPFTHAAEMPSSEPNYTNTPSAPVQHQYFCPETKHQTGFDIDYPTSFGGAYRPCEEINNLITLATTTSEEDDQTHSQATKQNEQHQNEQHTTGVSPQYSASPAVAHTPIPQQTQSVQGSTSPRMAGVGPTEAVRRRVGIMLRTQKRQQVKQVGRSSIKPPPSDGRRGKRTPTSDDSEAEQGKDALTKYKAAYERVEMLGGDPMQVSEGEDLDPKRARILVTSLQHELETLREKLIQTQKELHSLRQSCDDSSRSLRSSVSSGYFPMEEDDKAPLSAAPVTVYNHHRRC